ncbi:MAG: hypothetical protein H6978_02310 [Gammaproteobacteria bacterium]|nr:hypothetical protein [Gammaproteobacteria bacterium]
MVETATTLDALITATLADPLASAGNTQGAVGYVGFDLPLDIMLASERRFCHLPWQMGRATPRADGWLESAFPGWARSMLEDWADGVFDCLEFVVFSRGDDAAQRLYYYICELQRRGLIGGPQALIFDIGLIPRETSIAQTAQAIGKLLAILGLSATDLASGIARANFSRDLYAQLESSRGSAGHWYENLARACLFADLTDELAAATLPAIATTSAKILLAGSAPPDDRLHRAVEAAGGNVCGELHARALLRHGAAIANDGVADAVDAVARQVNANAYGPRAFGDRTSLLLSEVRRTHAEAVVMWLIEEDEAMAWHVARQRTALSEAGVAALILTRQRWDGSDGADAGVSTFVKEIAA